VRCHPLPAPLVNTPEALGAGPAPAAAGAPVRWIPPLRLGGAWQMAIDSWLLDRAVQAPSPAQGALLRLYHWQRPTLSLGFHQQRIPAHWRELADAGAIDLVRRPSGGRAVLHAGDLTYALVWPQASLRRREAYALACNWLRQAFNELGQPLRFGRQAPCRERSSCFATSTAADLVQADGSKRIGSAQLWRRGCLLQHGSILLSPPAALWQELFGHDPPALAPLPLQGPALEEQLRQVAARHLPMAPTALEDQPLTAAELAQIAPTLGRFRPEPLHRPPPCPGPPAPG
jgi:lipoate-protein ligase A